MWWPLPDYRRCDLPLEVTAVLPQLLRRSGVLEQNLVDVEGVKLAGAVTIDGLTNAGNEVPQLGLVILRDHRASYSSLRLVRHEYETTQRRRLAAVLADGFRGSRQNSAASRRVRCDRGLWQVKQEWFYDKMVLRP